MSDRFDAFTFAVYDHLEFGHQVHCEANVSGEFTERTDGLGIDLLALDFEADLFGERGGNIASGDEP